MIEVEVKVPVKDVCLIKMQLSQLGFSKGEEFIEEDYYFEHEIKSLREQDMALRIRKSVNLTNQKTEHFMTFKGPKMDQVSMTRKELEMRIEDGKVGREILTSLGYVSVRPLIKQRKYYHLQEITACLDQVLELGDYLELEIIVSDETKKEHALSRMLSVLEELGYNTEDIVRTSYLSMLQKRFS